MVLIKRKKHLSPFWTTRFLQVFQQEHAWLHSKMRGGSSRQNSGSRRPCCAEKTTHGWRKASRPAERVAADACPYLVVPAAQTQLSAHADAGGAVLLTNTVLVGRRNTNRHMSPPLLSPSLGPTQKETHLQVCNVAIDVQRGGDAVFRDVLVVFWVGLIVNRIDTWNGNSFLP